MNRCPAQDVKRDADVFRVAIVGGGPGGLFSAWHLEHKASTKCAITIFEASERPGGKLVTRQFAGAGPYEAGVAEIYDYSALGPDPLRELIEKELGLGITDISGGPCVIDGKIIHDIENLGAYFGEEVQKDALRFRERCAKIYSPQYYYQSLRERDAVHPWTNLSGEAVMAQEIPNFMARRYIRAMCHSDVAAPPHLTNGLNLLKNVLMDTDGYLNIFSVNGGNGQIAERLADELSSELRLNTPVRSIEALEGGGYRLEVGFSDVLEEVLADYVIVALPLAALSLIKWRSESLQRAIARHCSRYDRPAHYLRATILFERPFWREHLNTAWWMMDAFDGCCVYDEGARLDLGQWGALGFLIAGNSALELSNHSDEHITRACLDALPPVLAEGRKLAVDSRVHRWMSSVSAIPGGLPLQNRLETHRPDPKGLPGVFLVGDYMFDATLNGAMDSADTATDMLLVDLLERARENMGAQRAPEATEPAWRRSLELLFASIDIPGILRVAWGVEARAGILVLGSGDGRIVKELRMLGFDARGYEWRREAYPDAEAERDSFSVFGDTKRLPFQDDSFDVVVDAGLCCLPRAEIPAFLGEVRRVARRGLLFGSRTTDLTFDLLDRYGLLDGVQTLASRWDWSEFLFAAGFVHTLLDPELLPQAWKTVQAFGSGPGGWFENPESILYCVYGVTERDWEQPPQDSPSHEERPAKISTSKVQAYFSSDADFPVPSLP